MKSTTYKALLALAAPMMFAACSSDSNDVPAPVEEFEGIVLNIPNPNATRAAEDPEQTISKLVVLAYDQSKETKTPLVFDQLNVSTLETTSYTQVPVRLAAGTYHVYVLANIANTDLSSNTAWASLEESALQSATLSLSPASIAANNLPMTCNYKAIRQTPTNGNTPGTVFTNGEVTITPKATTHVYADLTYAVAKVRYTMINGKTPGLTMSSTSPIKVLNYATVESAMDYTTNLDLENQLGDATITGGKWYAAPEYTDEPADDAHQNLGDAVETPEDTYAYQGIVYVPERLFQEGDTDANKTKLQFVFTDQAYNEKSAFEFGNKETVIGAQDGSASKEMTGILRGYVYDIVAYTTAKTLSFQVRVNKWGYHKSVQELE